MASWTAEVAPPAPTHSRYYPRTPEKLDESVARWVSMADALGWGMTARPYPTIACSRTTGGPDKEKVGGSAARASIYAEQAAGRWVLRASNAAHASVRAEDQPAPTVQEATA
jgi:DNA (cytosine-5)-methyltransferase 1